MNFWSSSLPLRVYVEPDTPAPEEYYLICSRSVVYLDQESFIQEPLLHRIRQQYSTDESHYIVLIIVSTNQEKVPRHMPVNAAFINSPLEK